MASIPLPALSIQPQPQQDPLASLQKLMALKSLGNQQQLQQQQIQGSQQENDLRQLQLNDQQTLRQSSKNLDWSQPDTFDKWIQNAQQKGVSPQTLSQLVLQRSQYQEQLAKTDTATLAAQKEANSQLQGHIDAVKGIDDPVKRQQAAMTQGQQILSSPVLSRLAQAPGIGQQIQAMAQGKYVPTDDELSMFEHGLTDHNTQIDQQLKQSETAKNTTDQLLNQNKLDIIKSWKNNPQQVLAQVDQIVPPGGANGALNARTKSQVQFALGNGDVDGAKAAIKAAAEQVGAVEKEVQVQTNPSVIAAKGQVAATEAQAKQLIEGMERPVYALGPDGSRQLMSATDAIRSGIRTMTPVTSKEVGDDIQLNNRLGDVRQKIAQYEQNLQNLGKTVSSGDQGIIGGLLGKQEFKVGAFGTEIPVDRLNAALDKANIKNLSPDAKKLLISYYNARESMNGYQRVLSGSARGGEKAMELNLDALPNPATSDAPYAAESMRQFKQNLQIVGQGLPKIPGIKSPDEMEAQAAKPSNTSTGSASEGYTRIKASDGTLHDIPNKNMGAARRRDPGLRVVQ
jgi:hypothetical protein